MTHFNRDKARKQCQKQFNELGIYGGTQISRLIGFGEDPWDCYYLLRYPPKRWGESCKDIYSSMVGGWCSIKKINKKDYAYIEINCGIPKADKYIEKVWDSL
ncbi:TPA: hypothetical protein DCQ22_04155 [Candidatus Nomurabacteria bacterium]|nr:hypothetical protein [Candidatus Nomurabacteria bacterium]